MAHRSERTQAMPEDGLKGAPDGVNTQGKHSSAGGGEGQPYPNPHSGKSKSEKGGFANGLLGHGGQSTMGYHGSGQLGSKEVKKGGNRNAGARDD